ncbi:hypothetical protein CONPUDRAFT_74427 [Coniophora puteana RWD-64-598 SS2]|uniref:Uncharacterized protein n=1 Tax=Coniophora puteana (strain RWD-64-598) TaxID=741705 RepID=A0A5M3MIB4_CONPW|nr:uncharacterized protein CONPUDRAFT_74427 [Coniophora puteana RWD-64-598 SS2]EIW78833.1 hypothetical protein CONPUDRAFT_74427 [Coniophora puteana RWD-64-598 SS2]
MGLFSQYLLPHGPRLYVYELHGSTPTGVVRNYTRTAGVKYAQANVCARLYVAKSFNITPSFDALRRFSYLNPKQKQQSTADRQEVLSLEEQSQQLFYSLVAATVVVVYDYVQNIPLELRYFGLAFPIFTLDLYWSLQHFKHSRCFGVFVPTEIMAIVLLFLLQGMMMVRVYALLGKTKTIIYTLLTTFVVTQGVSVTLLCILIRASSLAPGDSDLFGFHICEVDGDIPQSAWILPANNAVLITYETFLCGCTLYYTAKHVKTSIRRNPARSIHNIALIVARDNLIYFFITLFGPWMIIALRKNYNTKGHGAPSNVHELSTIAFEGRNAQVDSEF